MRWRKPLGLPACMFMMRGLQMQVLMKGDKGTAKLTITETRALARAADVLRGILKLTDLDWAKEYVAHVTEVTENGHIEF